jgi:hypothetical protein
MTFFMISFPFFWVGQKRTGAKISRLLIRETYGLFPQVSPRKPFICKSCQAESSAEDTRLMDYDKAYVVSVGLRRHLPLQLEAATPAAMSRQRLRS